MQDYDANLNQICGELQPKSGKFISFIAYLKQCVENDEEVAPAGLDFAAKKAYKIWLNHKASLKFLK